MLFGATADAAGVLRIRRARDRVGDLAHERERRDFGRRIEDRGRGVGHEEHVRVLDRLPAADRRAVEAEALVEGRLVEGSNRQRDVLPGAEQVAELEIDHRGARLARPLERFARVGQRLAAVHQVVPLLDLRHRLTSADWMNNAGPNKKTPGLLKS
jgi:hypothetical protein